MAKLVDASVLGTDIARCEGSSPFPGTLCGIQALIAQLVEQLPLKETVAGSNPAKRTTQSVVALRARQLLVLRQDLKGTAMSLATGEPGSRVLMNEMN